MINTLPNRTWKVIAFICKKKNNTNTQKKKKMKKNKKERKDRASKCKINKYIYIYKYINTGDNYVEMHMTNKWRKHACSKTLGQ